MKIAFASGKGGTGKTTISTNLSSFLAKKSPTTLVDMDVEEPNSCLFIKSNLIQKHDKFKSIPLWNKSNCLLCGNCQKVCNFNAVLKLDKIIMIFPELCHSCHACSDLCPSGSLPMSPQKMGTLTSYKKGNLSFIESRLLVGQEQAVPLISQTFEYIEKEFSQNQTIIIDAPPGTSCPVIEVFKFVDFIFLVTEPTPFGLHDLILAVKACKNMNKNFAVIINRDGIGDEKVVRYCLANKIEIVAKIPNIRQAAELYSKGELMFNKIPLIKNEIQKIQKFIEKKV